MTSTRTTAPATGSRRCHLTSPPGRRGPPPPSPRPRRPFAGRCGSVSAASSKSNSSKKDSVMKDSAASRGKTRTGPPRRHASLGEARRAVHDAGAASRSHDPNTRPRTHPGPRLPRSAVTTGVRGAPALFPSGLILDRFEVGSVLGIGGTGTVFRALDRERGCDVAVKAIPQDATLRQWARREASVAGLLEHPHVVELLEVLEDEEYVYVVSQLVDGGDLATALRDRALGDAARLRVLGAVCDALAHAHARGVVHRDVKPANVLLGRDGTVKLADFGIAALADPDATVDDRLLGTLSYMAPEACRGQRPAAPADVWAAGVLVYEALSGANPFRARTPDELLERHAAKARSLGEVRSDLPKGVVNACMRALSSNPRRRPTALALRDALHAAVVQVEERPEAPAQRVAKPARHRKPAPKPPEPALPPSNVISLRTLPKPQRRPLPDVGGQLATALGAGAHA